MKTAEGELLKDDLSNFDDSKYKKPSVTVDIVIFTIKDNGLHVLLVKRKYPPFRGCWAIPGGFIHIDESLETAAYRELQEETNIKKDCLYIEQLKTYGAPFRDPRSRVITVAYFALVPFSVLEDQKIEGSDDAEEAKWFNINESVEKAFDHNVILEDAHTRLKNKIWYSDIAFNFVPKKFTWAQLKKVYEIILQEELTDANFRRKIKNTFGISELKEFGEREGSCGRLPNVLIKS